MKDSNGLHRCKYSVYKQAIMPIENAEAVGAYNGENAIFCHIITLGDSSNLTMLIGTSCGT